MKSTSERPRTRKTREGNKTVNRDPVSRGPASRDGTEPGTVMPHERDEVAESREGHADEDAKQAYDDIRSGKVDTDLRGTAGSNFRGAARKRNKRGVP